MGTFLRPWFGTGLAACTLVFGCNQAQRQPVRSVSRPMTTAAVMPAAPQVMAYAPPAQPVAPAPMVAAAPAPQTVVIPPERPTTLPAIAPAQPQKEMMQASYNPSAADKPVPRRSYADITAHPCFSHAPDYSCLSGELQYLHVRNSWRLRYASVDEEDRYGGSVTLTDTGSMSRYTSGQHVRVVGHLADPDSKEPSPEFRVRSIQPLSNP